MENIWLPIESLKYDLIGAIEKWADKKVMYFRVLYQGNVSEFNHKGFRLPLTEENLIYIAKFNDKERIIKEYIDLLNDEYEKNTNVIFFTYREPCISDAKGSIDGNLFEGYLIVTPIAFARVHSVY